MEHSLVVLEKITTQLPHDPHGSPYGDNPEPRKWDSPLCTHAQSSTIPNSHEVGIAQMATSSRRDTDWCVWPGGRYPAATGGRPRTVKVFWEV